MASSIKTKVHNILHCRRRRIEPRPQITCRLQKFYVKLIWTRGLRYASGQTNRQTNRETNKHSDHSTSHPYRGRSNYRSRNNSSSVLCQLPSLYNTSSVQITMFPYWYQLWWTFRDVVRTWPSLHDVYWQVIHRIINQSINQNEFI